MSLKKYEIDALVSEVQKAIKRKNNLIEIPSDETIINKLAEKDVDIAEMIKVKAKYIKAKEELHTLKQNIIATYRLNSYFGGEDYKALNQVASSSIEKIKEDKGFIKMSSVEIQNIIVLNGNGDLKDTLTSTLKSLGL